MLTLAIRGPLAGTMRELADRTGLNLAKLLGDMVLTYSGEVNAGYEPGTSLRQWQENSAATEGTVDA